MMRSTDVEPLPRCLVIVPVAETVRYIVGPELASLRRSVQFRVVCSAGADVERLRQDGWDIVTVPIARKLAPFRDLVTLVRLIREVYRFRPAILHSYMPKGGLLGQLAGTAGRVPLRLHSCRGLLYQPDMSGWRRWLFRLTDRLTSRLASRVLFVSMADRTFMVGEGLVSDGKAVWTGNGIDLGRFGPSPTGTDERAAFRSKLGYQPEQVVLLTVGRFVADKGYREIAEAAALLRTRAPHLRWLWIAPVVSGEAGVVEPDLLDRHGVKDVITVLGQQDDPVPYYRAADLLVHPSYREGVPRVVMEAAACGLPVVASDIPGCREVVVPGSNGLLVTPRSAAALAEGIASLLGDPGRLSAMAAAARAGSGRFDVQAVVGRVRHEYRLAPAA